MVLIGGKIAFLPSFRPGAALEAIERERLTALYLVPTAYWALLEADDLAQACGTVSKLAYAGAAMTESLTEKLSDALRPQVFINHYGSTEVYTFSIESHAAARPGSAGRPGLFTRLRLVEPDPERRVGPDEVVERAARRARSSPPSTPTRRSPGTGGARTPTSAPCGTAGISRATWGTWTRRETSTSRDGSTTW